MIMSAAEQAAAQAPATTAAPEDAGAAWLDEAIKTTRPRNDQEAARTRAYLQEYIRQLVQPGHVVAKDTEANIKMWIKEIDKKLSSQLNEIMHQSDFQKLESTWRGLHYLVHQSETGESLKIRVLNVGKRELFKDLEKAAEFDQSALFKKIYEEEYGQLGGEPYGMLVGDYEFDRNAEDIALLTHISKVAAAAHAPFVSASSPGMFNFERFTELSAPRDLAKIFGGVEYTAWKS